MREVSFASLYERGVNVGINSDADVGVAHAEHLLLTSLEDEDPTRNENIVLLVRPL
jgi:hypothetical protein